MSAEALTGFSHLIGGFALFFGLMGILRIYGSRFETLNRENRGWAGFESLVIESINDEAQFIKSFTFKRGADKKFPLMKAGQFLSFQIGEDPKLVRSYSISSSEQSRNRIQVSIKLLPEGVGSGWFHQRKVGDRVLATAPQGHFVDSSQNQTTRCYLAGGIGITPVFSMIKSLLAKGHTSQLYLFYGVRSQKDLAFHTELQELQIKNTNFHYFPILSHEESWNGDQGFLNVNFISSKFKELISADFYICGPDIMTNSLIKGLNEVGVQDSQIFNERFISTANLSASDIPEREAHVQYEDRILHYKGRENLLVFLEKNGLALPSACRVGVCGSCKCKIEGPVKSLTDSGLSPSERKRGLKLACVSFPEGDLRITPGES